MTDGPTRVPNRRLFIGWAGFFVLGIIWLAPGLGGGHFADDFQFVFDEPCRVIGGHFTEPNPQNRFYRPLQVAYSASVQCALGTSTLPLHLIQIALHALLALLVTAAALRLKLQPVAAWAAGAFFLVSQAGVAAVLGNDTLSQLAGALFGCAAAYVTWHGLSNGSLPLSRWIPGATALLLLSLMWKETSAGFYAVLIALLAVVPGRPDERRVDSGRLLAAAAFTLALIAYVALRTGVMGDLPGTGETRYDMRAGPNVIANLGQFAAAGLSPISTVWIYRAWWDSDMIRLTLLLLPALLVLVGLIGSIALRTRHKLPFAVTLLSILALLPALLLNTVSELYVYNALPFGSLLVAVGLTEVHRRKPALRKTAALFVLMILLMNVASSWQKSRLMRINGDRAERLLAEVTPHARAAERHGKVLLVNTRADAFRYSIFVMPEFDVVARGIHRVRQLADRPALDIRVVDQTEVDREPEAILLMLDDRDQVERLPTGGRRAESF